MRSHLQSAIPLIVIYLYSPAAFRTLSFVFGLLKFQYSVSRIMGFSFSFLFCLRFTELLNCADFSVLFHQFGDFTASIPWNTASPAPSLLPLGRHSDPLDLLVSASIALSIFFTLSISTSFQAIFRIVYSHFTS